MLSGEYHSRLGASDPQLSADSEVLERVASLAPMFEELLSRLRNSDR